MNIFYLYSAIRIYFIYVVQYDYILSILRNMNIFYLYGSVLIYFIYMVRYEYILSI